MPHTVIWKLCGKLRSSDVFIEALGRLRSNSEPSRPSLTSTSPVQIDMSTDRLLPQTPVQFAQQMIDSTNAVLQLQTSEFAAWEGRTPNEMLLGFGLPLPVGTAVDAFLHVPIVASPNVRFVLTQVLVRPENTNGVVDPFSSSSVTALKRGRLPLVPGLMNIWVTRTHRQRPGLRNLPFRSGPERVRCCARLSQH